jgi:hypothetical protein
VVDLVRDNVAEGCGVDEGSVVKRNDYMLRNFQMLLAALQYPVNKDGSVMDLDLGGYGLAPGIAYHLNRAGVRIPNNTEGFPLVEEYDDPLIKKRKVYGPGVYEDACLWVPFHTPDDPLANLEQMTMAQIEALPDDVKFEAKRRLGMLPPTPENTEPTPGWSVQPFITITDAPDTETEWST